MAGQESSRLGGLGLAAFRSSGDVLGLMAAFEYLKGAQKKDGCRFFRRTCSDRTRGNGFKLKEGRLRLDIRKKLSMLRVVRP